MLKTILSISGKPGLFKLIAQGRNTLIVETLDDTKKRLPARGNDKVTSLGDISMYTTEDDIPLSKVLEAVKAKENGAPVSLNIKKASAQELQSYFAEVLPNFDRDRVYNNDIKKLLSWYNILIQNGITEFEEKTTEEVAEEETKVTE